MGGSDGKGTYNDDLFEPDVTAGTSDGSPSPEGPAPPEPPPADPTRRYLLEDEVGRGGLGAVHRAFDVSLGRTVAVKSLHRQSFRSTQRFDREMHLTARLQHPNIIPVYAGGRDPDGTPYLAMRMVDGRTLADAIDARATLQRRLELLPHVLDACNAVAYAHSQHIVHRDIKPENVLIGAFGETVVIDWGLAKDLDAEAGADEPVRIEDEATDEAVLSGGSTSSMTRVGAILGTPPYMAPEQAKGHAVGPPADVYALGAVLYETLGGVRPYADVRGGAKEVLARVIAGPPKDIRQLAPKAPPDLVAVVERAMARRPEDRYPSAEELAADLDTFAAGRFVAAYHYSPRERIVRAIRRNPGVSALLGVGVLLLLLALAAIGRAYQIAEQEREAAQQAMSDAMVSRDAAQSARDAMALEGARFVASRSPGRAITLLDGLSADMPFDGTVRTVASTAWAAGHPEMLDIEGVRRMRVIEDGRVPGVVALVVGDRWLEFLDTDLETIREVELPSTVVAVEVGATLSLVCAGNRTFRIAHDRAAELVPLDLAPCVNIVRAPTGDFLVQHALDATLVGSDGTPGARIPVEGEMWLGADGLGWELQMDTTRVWRGAVPGPIQAGVMDFPYHFAVSPDGTRIAMMGEQPALALVDARNTSRVVRGVEQEWLTPGAWLDDDWLTVGGAESVVELVDARAATVVHRMPLDSRVLLMQRLGPGRVALITEEGTLGVVHRLASGAGPEVRFEVLATHPGRPEALHVLPDGRVAVRSEGRLALYAPEAVGRRLVASGLGRVRDLTWWEPEGAGARLIVASRGGVGSIDPSTRARSSWSDRPAAHAAQCGSSWWVGFDDGVAAYSFGNGHQAPTEVVAVAGTGPVMSLECRPDGQGVWVGTRLPGEVVEVGVDGIDNRWFLGDDLTVSDVVLGEGGELHVAANGWWTLDPEEDTPELRVDLRMTTRQIVPWNGALAAVYRDGNVGLADGTRVPVLNGLVSRVFDVEGGLAVLGENGQASWVPSGGEAIPLRGHVQYLSIAARSPTTGVLATSGWDAQVRLWDLSTDPPEPRLLAGHEDAVYALAWSADGKTLFSGDRLGRVMAWSDPLPTEADALRDVVGVFAEAVRDGRTLPPVDAPSDPL